MATTIPEWVPKFIRQVVAYRERQKVTHERLNELFNLVITQGDWNTETIELLLNNLTDFDTQYIADMAANDTAHANLLANFNQTIATIRNETNTAITNMDIAQRALMAAQLLQFQTDLATAEDALNLTLTQKLAEIQTMVTAMDTQYTANQAQMATLITTVNTLRADILADNEAIMLQIQTYKTDIEQTISGAQGIIDGAVGIYEDINPIRVYQKATGSATAIVLTLPDLEDGTAASFRVKTNNNGAATTINGVPLYKPGTTTAPTLTSGKAVTVWYDSAGTCFFLKASAEGNALAENVLAGKTFSTDDDAGLVGTMANHGSRVFTPSDAEQSGNAGYYDGIIINPRPSLSGDSAMADVLAGKTFYGNDYTKKTGNMLDRGTINHALPINGSFTIPAGKHSGSGKVTQAIPTKTAETITPGTTNKTIGAGQYLSGAQTIAGDPDLIAANILSGKNIFGVAGNVIAGKRFASGTVVYTGVSGPTENITRYNSSGSGPVAMYYMSVSGIAFMPRLIRWYDDKGHGYGGYAYYTDDTYAKSISYNEGDRPYMFNTRFLFGITADGFVMPLSTNSVVATSAWAWIWEAWE